ncbi:MAG: sigma 54-interacting transcriptional regulator [Deltaproteobacteria bacterium]|nr:sigma 54-interacting transcriptional regulator [Nannocystaceae bacterium]
MNRTRAHSPTLTLPTLERTAARWWLRVRGGPQLTLDSLVRIGTAPACELRLVDRYASALHAEIRRDGERVTVRDHGSKNGTWVGGVRVEQAVLHAGMAVRIGSTWIELVDDDGAPPPLSPAPLGTPSPMLGRSPAFAQLELALRRFSDMRRPVLLRGETGTGKELAARYLHDVGPRAGAPFVAINCASIVDALAESELFGHVRGAFTGAVRPHAGAFVRADGGTLFLDEIGELPLGLQAKLLRVLECGRVQAVGGEVEATVDVRVIAATHRDLERMVAERCFREDLFHRLSVLVALLPPLRERGEDIPLLLARFVREASEELGREVVLAPGCVEAACAHPWPGNIRALRNAVVRAATMSDGPVSASSLLPPRSAALASAARDCAHEPAGARPRVDWSRAQSEQLQQEVSEHGSIRRAAAALGIPRSTLGARLKR